MNDDMTAGEGGISVCMYRSEDGICKYWSRAYVKEYCHDGPCAIEYFCEKAKKGYKNENKKEKAEAGDNPGDGDDVPASV